MVDNGSDKDDVICRCDYRQGYEYVFKTMDGCTCSPMKEDCTCILNGCQEDGLMLSQGKTYLI